MKELRQDRYLNRCRKPAFLLALAAAFSGLVAVGRSDREPVDWKAIQAKADKNPRSTKLGLFKPMSVLVPDGPIITVNSTAQSPGSAGDCTLGEAIQAANLNQSIDACAAGSGADTIIVPAGTYTLTSVAYSDPLRGASGLPPIVSDIVFQGAGKDSTIIERQNNVPEFRLMLTGNESVGDGAGNITLNDLTMRGGAGDEFGGAIGLRGGWNLTLNRASFNNNYATRFGGAIANRLQSGIVVATDCTFTNNESGEYGGAMMFGNVTVVGTTFTDNRAQVGGAVFGGGFGNFSINISDSIFNNNHATSLGGAQGGGAITYGGHATITRTQFTGNTAASAGGAIQTGGPTLNLIDSVITGNHALSGGGLYLENCALNLNRSTIANNQAITHHGGGIYINHSTNTTISNSTISGNSAGLDGGGISTATANVSITNTTIDDNTSGQYGGGMFAAAFAPVTLSLNNVTLTANQAVQGGGLMVFHSAVSTTTANSIIALNTASYSAPDLYAPSSFISLGYNLIGVTDGSNFVSAQGDQTGTTGAPIDPKLGPLQNNGGTTFTRALLSGSPALDTANPDLPGSGKGACEPTDQRGNARPEDGNNDGLARCDIGAFEQLRVPVCITPPAGMTGWWPFDGNGNDILHGNNASLFGNQSFTTGKVEQGLAFDAVDDHAVAPGDAALDVGQFDGMTFDLWFNPAEIQTARPLIEWESGAGPHLWMSADFAEGGRGVGSLFVNLPDATGYHIFSSAPGLLTANTWQHVAVTYDKTSGVAKIFLNGAPVAEQNFGSFRPQTTGDVFFGYRPFGVLAGRRFLGAIDEVEVFNRALNDTEIHDLYYADSAGKCKPAATPTPTPTPRSCLEGHVSWYRGENNALDSSGSNNGTPRNGATFAPGKVGQGFLLDGVDDYIECPDNTSLDPGIASFTIDAWIKSSLTTGYQPIIHKYECGGVCPVTATSYYALYLFDGKLQGSLRDTNGNEQTLTGTNNIADGNFHHVAMVRDVGASELRIYVDGVVAVSAPLTVTSTIQNDDGEADPLTIGFQRPPLLNPSAAVYFNGVIDEVDYFSRALSPSEISTIFNAGSNGKCSSVAPPAVIDVTEQITVNDRPSVLLPVLIAVNENVSVRDLPSLLPSAMIGINENISVNDTPKLLLPVLIAVNENVSVRDAPSLLPSAMIGINENISVNDTPKVLLPVLIAVNENVSVRDLPSLLPSAMIGINENISVSDTPKLLLPVLIAVNENVSVRDVSSLLPSAMIGINERISVNDTPTFLLPAIIAVNENISVRDLPSLLPSAMIAVNERVSINDQPRLLLPTVIAINENVSVRDEASLLRSAMIGVNENITVSDQPRLLLPALIAVNESISVRDLPSLIRSVAISVNERISVRDIVGLLLTQPVILLPTPTGSNVNVTGNNVSLTFENVSSAGTTTISQIDPRSAGQLPGGYQLAGSGMAFDIVTTASFSGLIKVCFSVPSVNDPAVFAGLRVLHYENGALVDKTTSSDFASRTICATVSSLSPFVLAQLVTTPRALLQTTINDLATLRASATARRDQQRLDQIIKQLANILGTNLWLDESHLRPNGGEKVFGDIESALLKLIELDADSNTAVSHATLQLLIRRTVSAARLLAQTAVIDASSANSNPTEILKAKQALISGDMKLALGGYVQAVRDYRDTWIHALNATR